MEIEVKEKHCLVLQKLFSCWFFIFSCHPMTFKFQSSAAILPINSLFCVSLLKFPPVTCQGQEPQLSRDLRVGFIYSSLRTSVSSFHQPAIH